MKGQQRKPLLVIMQQSLAGGAATYCINHCVNTFVSKAIQHRKRAHTLYRPMYVYMCEAVPPQNFNLVLLNVRSRRRIWIAFWIPNSFGGHEVEILQP